MAIYYNEFDRGKAAWLRELMKAGAITAGDVDERSISNVTANDLRGVTRAHFFAGIGLWDAALNAAGWPADREVWTASPPCQPFSAAGKRKGKADERHLWPVLFPLIEARRPKCIIGEQVSGVDGLAWLSDVQLSLGSCGYTFGAISAPACGVGAPMRRERLYWVALASGARLPDGRIASRGRSEPHDEPQRLCNTLRTVGDSDEAGSQGLRLRGNGGDECAVGAAGVAGAMELPAGDGRQQWRAESNGRGAASGCGVGGMANPELHSGRSEHEQEPRERSDSRPRYDAGLGGCSQTGGMEHAESLERRGRRDHEDGGRRECAPADRGPVNGYWRDAAWVYCKDGKYRAVERTARSMADVDSGDLGRVRVGDSEITHPLQAKGKARVLRLRGYGDAIVLEQAIAWIRAVMEVAL